MLVTIYAHGKGDNKMDGILLSFSLYLLWSNVTSLLTYVSIADVLFQHSSKNKTYLNCNHCSKILIFAARMLRIIIVFTVKLQQ